MAERRGTPRPHAGSYVVVAGPDGAGKSTVVEDLEADVLVGPVLRLHHRPHVLGPRATSTGPVTDPHAEPPYPPWLARLKVLFLYADHLLGWLVKVRPWLRRGGAVVLERGWWDLVVDPGRYRLPPVPRLVTFLGRLLPRPDLTLVLGGDPGLIAGRKSELSVAETARQLDAWRRLPRGAARVWCVDATRDRESVRREVRSTVVRAAVGPSIALPHPRIRRWVVPTGPRRAAVASLGLYQPVTRRGRAGWEAARVVAACGGFRLLRTHDDDLPSEVLELLAPHVPPKTRVALAFARIAGRCTALVIDPARGEPILFAKIALDVRGGSVLAAESHHNRELAPLLPPGLHAPELLHDEPGLLLFRPVTAIARPRPWQLAPGVAADLGRFFANGATGDGWGPSHGDCAPWNLLHTREGWYLVDWADARREAPPFEDLFHHLIQSHALLGRPRRDELVAGIRGEGWIGELVACYARGADLPVGEAEARFLDHLVRSEATQDRSRPDGRAGAVSRRALADAFGDRS